MSSRETMAACTAIQHKEIDRKERRRQQGSFLKHKRESTHHSEAAQKKTQDTQPHTVGERHPFASTSSPSAGPLSSHHVTAAAAPPWHGSQPYCHFPFGGCCCLAVLQMSPLSVLLLRSYSEEVKKEECCPSANQQLLAPDCIHKEKLCTMVIGREKREKREGENRPTKSSNCSVG